MLHAILLPCDYRRSSYHNILQYSIVQFLQKVLTGRGWKRWQPVSENRLTLLTHQIYLTHLCGPVDPSSHLAHLPIWPTSPTDPPKQIFVTVDWTGSPGPLSWPEPPDPCHLPALLGQKHLTHLPHDPIGPLSHPQLTHLTHLANQNASAAKTVKWDRVW
jgi:hypothetical protein